MATRVCSVCGKKLSDLEVAVGETMHDACRLRTLSQGPPRFEEVARQGRPPTHPVVGLPLRRLSGILFFIAVILVRLAPHLGSLIGSFGGSGDEPAVIILPTPAPRNAASTVDGRVPAATQTFAARYREECSACGATFTVDQVEVFAGGLLRIHTSVENSGEFGSMKLILTGSSIDVFNAAQAEQYRAAFDNSQAARTVPRLLSSQRTETRLAFPSTGSGFVPSTGTGIPANLAIGQRWTGWLQTSIPLATTTTPVALVLHLGSIMSEKGGPASWASYAEGLPFIELSPAAH